MYIEYPKKIYNGKSYTSCLLRESYRDENGKPCKRTILNLNKLPKDLSDFIKSYVNNKNSISFSDKSIFSHTQGKSYGALKVILDIAQKLGIKKALGNSKDANFVMLMIAGIILSPKKSKNYISNFWSKNQAVNEVLSIEDVFNENDLYKALDFLTLKQEILEEKIRASIVKKTNSSNTLFLYDITSSYVEGDHIAFTEFGYNRDKKKGKKQIVIGLMTDENGMPVSVEVFNGKKRDFDTVSSQLEKLKNRFNAKNVVFVGDRGMIKSQQIDEINDKNWNYITGITRPQIEKLLNDKVIQLEIFDTDLQEIMVDEIRYVLRKNPIREKEITDNLYERIEKVTEFINEKNTYLEEHKKANPLVAVKHITSYISKLKLAKYIVVSSNERTITFKINNEAIKDFLKLAGCYVLKTDLKQNECSKEDIHSRYKDLYQVEEDFKNLKTEFLKIRPIHVRTPNHVKGHVFVYTLALMIVRYVEEKLKDTGFSKAYIWESLDKIQYQNIIYNEHSFKSVPSILNNDQQIILDKLNIKFPKIL